MIDYNHKATYVGLGVSLLDWYWRRRWPAFEHQAGPDTSIQGGGSGTEAGGFRDRSWATLMAGRPGF